MICRWSAHGYKCERVRGLIAKLTTSRVNGVNKGEEKQGQDPREKYEPMSEAD